jgi:hypothetical protein
VIHNKLATVLIGASAAGGASAYTFLSAGIHNADSVSMFLVGVCFNTVFMAVIGSLLALAVADPISPRSKMWGMLVASAVLGSASIAILPHIADAEWIKEVPMQAVAVIVGFLSRWVIPAVIEAIPGKVKSIISNAGGK